MTGPPNVPPRAPRELSQQDAWDRFIDDLDRAGQAGDMGVVLVPAFRVDLPTGMPFGDLTKPDIENLSRFAGSLGRRADVIRIMWEDLRKKRRAATKARAAADAEAKRR